MEYCVFSEYCRSCSTDNGVVSQTPGLRLSFRPTCLRLLLSLSCQKHNLYLLDHIPTPALASKSSECLSNIYCQKQASVTAAGEMLASKNKREREHGSAKNNVRASSTVNNDGLSALWCCYGMPLNILHVCRIETQNTVCNDDGSSHDNTWWCCRYKVLRFTQLDFTTPAHLQ